MGRFQIKLITSVFVMTVGVYSCSPTKAVLDNCLSEKIKFDLPLDGQLIDYEFCVPDNEMIWKELLTINPELKKTNSKGRSNCGKDEVLVLGNTDNKAFKSKLCKIVNLDYVKEVNQTHGE